jgi:hypothetical protein
MLTCVSSSALMGYVTTDSRPVSGSLHGSTSPRACSSSVCLPPGAPKAAKAQPRGLCLVLLRP